MGFVHPSIFRLPDDPAAPIVMVGPGTGVAPFRSLLRHLSASDTRTPRPGHVRLYFGCRRSDEDFLYEEEFRGYLKAGTLWSHGNGTRSFRLTSSRYIKAQWHEP